MDAMWVVLGALQLVLGIDWIALVWADRPRPPEGRRHFKARSLRGPTALGVCWLVLGVYWLGRGLLD
jgi:hypothetical protein